MLNLKMTRLSSVASPALAASFAELLRSVFSLLQHHKHHGGLQGVLVPAAISKTGYLFSHWSSRFAVASTERSKLTSTNNITNKKMAKKTTTTTEETSTPEEVKTITVIARKSIYENGRTYAPGDKMEVTEERAAALGANVGAPE
jgi:hypothetical protein